MPLQNRQEFETSKLHGVNLAADPTKLQIGWFTHLANWIPAQRLKIKKKRGVDDVPTGDFFTPIPCPTAPVPGCIDTSPRGQQLVEILDYFVNPYPDSGNTRTSWGFIDDNEEVFTLAGFAECNGGNMGYTNECCVVNHFVGGGAPTIEVVDNPDIGIAFVNTRCGVSDRPTWASINIFTGGQFSFDNGPIVTYDIPIDEFGARHMEAWAVKGNRVWIYSEHNGDMTILEYNRLTTDLLNNYTPWGLTTASPVVTSMQLTDNYLYCLRTFDALSAISKIDRNDGTLVAEFDVTGLSPQFIAVTDDNLIYLLCAGNPAKIYYLENFTDFIYVGNTTGQGFVPFGYGTGIFKNGALYYGSSGFGGFTPDIFKIAIECPPDEAPVTIASISTDLSTVVAGNIINVSWADILLSTPTDEIWLVVAPDPGELGFAAGPTGSGFYTGGGASGTHAFTVPGGTAPGSYIFILMASPQVYMAQSAPFTISLPPVWELGVWADGVWADGVWT